MLFIPPQKRGCCGECTQGFGQLAPKLQQEQGRSAPCYGAPFLRRTAQASAMTPAKAAVMAKKRFIWNAAPFSYFDCFGFRAGVILLHQE